MKRPITDYIMDGHGHVRITPEWVNYQQLYALARHIVAVVGDPLIVQKFNSGHLAEGEIVQAVHTLLMDSLLPTKSAPEQKDTVGPTPLI